MVPLLLLPLLLAALPPMSGEQRVRLESARDGGDHREEAFLALAEHVAEWEGRLGDAAIRLDPDHAGLLAEPARYRGDLCRVTGTIQQRSALRPPYDVAEEWFLRTEGGRPLIVYVVDLGELPPAAVRPGRRVSVPAWFYKRVSLTARDGVRRDYPAFVGSRPRLLGRGTGALDRLWIVTVPVAVLLAAFLLLLVYTRRRGPRAAPWPHRPATTGEPPDEPLPDDPGDALAELRRRAQR